MKINKEKTINQLVINTDEDLLRKINLSLQIIREDYVGIKESLSV